MADEISSITQSHRFMVLYALAVAGGSIAYVPFLTVLLPVRVTVLAGAESVTWLAYIAFCGAISASLTNILFGWLSDLTGNRRGWIAAGLILSCSLLLSVSLVSQHEGLFGLIGVIVAWQAALNMMLAPLAAWAGDCVPDRQKGVLGGMLSIAPALGAMVGILVTWPSLISADMRLATVALIVAACVLPALVFGAPRSFPELTLSSIVAPQSSTTALRLVPAATVRMWIARLLIQISEASLFAYLLFWFSSISADFGDNDAARIFGLILLGSVPLAIMVGRWADRSDRPVRPLVIGAGVTAMALLLMAFAQSIGMAIAGYVLFGLSSSIFLAIHAAQTLRFLPRPERRGRDLAIFNLTNTVPSLIMPGLVLVLLPTFGFSGLFILLGFFAVFACGLLVTIKPMK